MTDSKELPTQAVEADKWDDLTTRLTNTDLKRLAVMLCGTSRHLWLVEARRELAAVLRSHATDDDVARLRAEPVDVREALIHAVAAAEAGEWHPVDCRFCADARTLALACREGFA